VALVESNRRFERMVYAVSEAMGRVVELRDPYTQGHEVRVARLAKQIAQKMHLSADDIEGIEMASLVHDIGKLCVPVSILSKPGRLSDLEFAMIKEHSLAGYSVLKNIDLPWPVADIVLAHHERCDGSGYPYGLVAADIPQGALIVAVADVVEAMASHRPYRPALGIDAAVAEIANHPAKYDAEVVRAFMALYASGRIDFEEPSRETAVSLSAESPSGEGASAVLDVDRHHRGSSVEARHCSGARSSS
jgi:HD-GYP domain-containing protein (c-di-GMP phosphodiesterase class II)